ncbi:myosin heavy chain IB-like [Lutra lutra]|uniref:myosin heavy chain IB-like n=1 Tax=Lutra lutra TaxID=9657 RepID=UPI001FD065C1|nr:myosin heavy chain IB-like [Lutra lutra]
MLAAAGAAGGGRGRGAAAGAGAARAGGRACLGPAARSCVQYVCLGGRPRASVRRGPRGPAQLRDCRSRSAPARLVPAGSCARPSDVNGGNGGGRRGFGLSQAESAAGRGREGQRRGPTGGGGPWGGGRGRRAPAGPGPAPPGTWGWAGAAGAGRVTSRRAAPPPVPRPGAQAGAPAGEERCGPPAPAPAGRDRNGQRPGTCGRGRPTCTQTSPFIPAWAGPAQDWERIILETPLFSDTEPPRCFKKRSMKAESSGSWPTEELAQCLHTVRPQQMGSD